MLVPVSGFAGYSYSYRFGATYYHGGGVGGGLLATRGRRARSSTPATREAAIDRAVWSFWSRPFRWELHRGWTDELSHLLSWVLSVRTASRHFATTSLVTDDAGADLLVNRLELPFARVSTSLNALRGSDPSWWVLGKLCAYRQQETPFIHLDSDVFLWDALGAGLSAADVVAQNPEYAPIDDSTFYRPTWFTSIVRQNHGWLPHDLHRYVTRGGNRAICVGILGGQNIDFVRRYAEQAIALLQSPRNVAAWQAMGAAARLENSVLIEQYYLAACCEAHNREHAPLDVRHVFPSQDAARVPAEAARAGYSHLMEGKRNPELTALLAERVRRDHPADYVRCLRALDSTG